MHRLAVVVALATLTVPVALAQTREPIIDMHLHASHADAQGPPPMSMCAPLNPMPSWDQSRSYPDVFLDRFKSPSCADPIRSPMTDAELMTRTLDVMKRHNVIGVLSGPAALVEAWRAADSSRFIAGLVFELGGSDVPLPAALRERHRDQRLAVLGEVTNQYAGILPDDPRMEPYWQLAEELDIPVGYHIGPGPPGVIYLFGPHYRARMHSALAIEEVLVKHPKLRVYVMHAGYPLLDDMLAVLYAHPQLYVDVGVIVYTQPRPAFYRYLQALVDAGFGNRVMFGSDQMVWPEAIGLAIEGIESADFLTAEQKRDIFYNNAARFLRLDEKRRTDRAPKGRE